MMGNRQQAVGNRIGFAGLLLLLVWLACCTAAWAGGRNPRVVVVVANRLVLSDLDDPSLPTIHKMLHEGAAGLISPNCLGPKSEASVMLTANAGSPCKGGAYVSEFCDFSEILPDGTRAGDAFVLRTGCKAPAGSAVFLGLGPAQRDMLKLGAVPAKLGALGDALHAAGLKTGAFGNADMAPDGVDRSVAALAMDSRGIADVGGLGLPVHVRYIAPSPLPSPPGEGVGHAYSLGLGYGRTTAPSPLLSPSGDGVGRCDFAVLCFGASTVLDESKTGMSEAAYAFRRGEVLRALDRTLAELVATGATVVLVSFSPPNGTPWDQLTPIAVYPSRKPGLLSSTTTRTPGIVAASDFAPTVLKLMGVSPSSNMIGRPAGLRAGGRAPARLAEMSTRVTTNERILTPVAVSLAGIGAVSFTIAALIVAFGLKPSRKVIVLLKAGLVTGACMFGSLLLAPLAPAGVVGYVVGTVAALVVMVGICLGIARRFGRSRALPIVIAFAMTALIVLVDALTGGYLCKWCGPSSYQISGMRFYGVGNEYAGVLISMSAIVALWLRKWKWFTAVIGLAVIGVLGSGSLGANYGGTGAAVVTFVLLWLALSRNGFHAKHVGLALVLAIAVVVAVAVIDLAIEGSAGTHAACATGLTEKIGAGYLVSVAVRKVGFNLKTTFSGVGIKSFFAFVPFLALWFWGVQGKVRKVFGSGDHREFAPSPQPSPRSDSVLVENAKAPGEGVGRCESGRVIAGVKAILVGSAAAYALNDSGIVFAAIMIAMTVLVLLYSVLEEVEPCRES